MRVPTGHEKLQRPAGYHSRPGPRSAVHALRRAALFHSAADDQDLLLGSMQYMPKTKALLMDQGTTFTHMMAATPVW